MLEHVLSEDWENGGFGLYIHWPFCAAKCPYCDFNSHILLKSIPEKDYVASLFKDIDEDKNLTSGRKIKTIFFGGGTPSLFSASSIETVSYTHLTLPTSDLV